METLRDDPLVDGALRKLGGIEAGAMQARPGKECGTMAEALNDMTPDAVTLAREARRVLRRLCENGAVLAVAAEMGRAGRPARRWWMRRWRRPWR